MSAREDLLVDWLNVPSVSGKERPFLECLQEFFEARGYRCDRQKVADQRWNLVVRTDADPTFMYSTHVDTVPPHLPVRRNEESVFGRGACDTKGGIVAMAEAGDRLRDGGEHGFGYLFVVGEEVDHCGAKAARHLDLETQRIILCEPTENQVVAAQKGMIKLLLRATGVAGHSAYPARGDSAVHHLLDAVDRLRAEPWEAHETLGPTTLNVGIIEGGVAANVFAPQAYAEVLVRTVSPTAPLLERMQELLGDDATVEVPACNDPVFFEPPDDVETTTVAFNTDATYLTEIAPVWLVGPGDIQVAHSDHEHIHTADLADGVELYERLGRLALASKI